MVVDADYDANESDHDGHDYQSPEGANPAFPVFPLDRIGIGIMVVGRMRSLDIVVFLFHSIIGLSG